MKICQIDTKQQALCPFSLVAELCRQILYVGFVAEIVHVWLIFSCTKASH